jgi:hypothetical protein
MVSPTKIRKKVDAMPSDAQLSYLREMISLERSEWSTRGLELRSTFIGSHSGYDGKLKVADRSIVDGLIAFLNRCQKNFWENDSGPIFEELAKQSFEQAPELQSVAKRLLDWYQQRETLRGLVSKFGQNSLPHQMMDMARMTSREMAVARARIANQQQSLGGSGLKRQAKLIKKDYPAIYALAPDWIDELIQRKR